MRFRRHPILKDASAAAVSPHMAEFYEHHARSIAKSVTFRIIVLVSDSLIIYAVTRRLDLTLSVIVLSNLSSTTLYYLHERAWNAIRWGRTV